jgi:small subunit ribosomal protein S17
MNKELRTKRKKVFSGTVVSDKMKDTIVVAVGRYSKHAKYGKFIKRVKRYKAHDKDNKHKVGDRVRIEETRPISKDKTFQVIGN